MGNFKKERKMKVYAQSGYKYKDTATIILKGDWLEDCGFEPGTPITAIYLLRMLRHTAEWRLTSRNLPIPSTDSREPREESRNFPSL